MNYITSSSPTKHNSQNEGKQNKIQFHLTTPFLASKVNENYMNSRKIKQAIGSVEHALTIQTSQRR